jgi:DNA-binding IclR family transcriptional regulator
METTVVKGLKMLEALALNGGPCALTDMARLCGVTKSNAHRLLKTLEECHYVRQDPKTRAYEPTLRLWELGTQVFRRLDLRIVAHAHLQALARATRESVHLSIFENGEVIYVDKVDSDHAVQ